MHRPPLRERVVNIFAQQITRHAGVCIGLTLTLVGVFCSFLPQARPINDTYDYLVDHDPATKNFHRFRHLFEKDEFFVIAYREKNLFTHDKLVDLSTITESLKKLENVKDVVSLANVVDMRGNEDTFDADDFLKEIPTDPSALKALRQRALANHLYHKTLLSKDAETTAIVVFTYTPPPGMDFDPDAATSQLLKDVNERLAPYRQKGTAYAFAGAPVTTFYLGEYMRRDTSVFLPISLALTLGTIAYVFRNVRLLWLSLLGIGLTLASTIGLAGWAKIPINNASVAAVPLVMALALSDTIHLFSHLDRRYWDRAGGSSRDAMAGILRDILFPCLLTSVNTAIGFFSFGFNRVSAIRSFGILAGAGMIFEFIITFGLVAPLLVYLRPHRVYFDHQEHFQRAIPTFLRWIYKAVGKRPAVPFAICLGAMVLGAGLISRIRVNTNLEELFQPASPLRRDAEFTRKNLSGTDPIDIVFESRRDRFKDPQVLAQIEIIENEVATLVGVDSILSFGDYLKEMNKAFHAEDPKEYRLPKNQRMLEQYLLLYGRDDLEDYVTPTFDTLRLVIRADVPSSEKIQKILGEIEAILRRHPIEGVQSTVSGMTVLSDRTARVMVDDQINNIGQTVILIWLIMVGVLKSWGLSLLFLVPNLFPIAVNFGIMGFLGIPMDTGTSLIAASAFGIIVDDTVHFFTAYQQRRQRGQSISRALEETTFEKGESAVSSFFIMMIAFGVLTLSHFQPIYYFGLLNIVILMVGLIGDQVFLKSIFMLWSRWRERTQTPVGPPTLPTTNRV